MKFKIILMLLAVSGVFFASCKDNDNDDETRPTNQVVEMAFAKMYPGASKVNWKIKAEYSVADFHSENFEREAWFDTRGIWYLTETDLPFKDLPSAVKESFSASKFGAWTVDNVDYLPTALPDVIKSYITKNFPIAKVVEVDIEDGMVEVDILDVNSHRELKFKSTGEWLYTKTEVSKLEVPALVLKALIESAYGTYKIEEIHIYNVPGDSYYYFELEMGDKEVNLEITTNGVIKVVK